MKKDGFELIKWSGDFSCGINLLDNYHLEMIELINSIIIYSMNDDTEINHFNALLSDMLKKFRPIFAAEERIMHATMNFGYIEHIRAHKSFLITVNDIRNDFKKGKKHNMAVIINYIKIWLLSHINIMDKSYFKNIIIPLDDSTLAA